jgi:hypothetical protein
LVLTGGYVESATNGSLILWSSIPFYTVEDALTMVGMAFLEATKTEVDRHHDFQKRYGDKCPHCDKPLVTGEPSPVDAEELASAIYDYITGMTDGTHEYWESLSDHGWDVGLVDAVRAGLTLADAVVVHEYADQLLADLVTEGGRTVVERGATGHEHRYDWLSHMDVPDGMVLYRDGEASGD